MVDYIKAVSFQLTASILLVGAASLAQAGEFGYHLKTGVGQSDNILRQPDAPQKESMGSAGFDLSLLHQSRKIDADALADLAWVDYLDNTFDSELTGNFDGRLRIDFVPQRFAWTFQDNFGQGRIDPLAAVTPANREDINYFTTGPELLFDLASLLRLRS